MEFLLNEKSLHGQFNSADDFLESFKPVKKCIEIIHNCSDIQIYKTQDFYDCMITKKEKISDLKTYGMSDKLLRFKLSLDKEIYEKPYWDKEPVHDISQEFIWEGEDVTATSLAEAAVKGSSLLSFESDKFKDCVLMISNGGKDYRVDSVHTPKYLTEQYKDIIDIDEKQVLTIRYEGTRVDCSTLEEGYGVSILEKNELSELISTLDKFADHESWESIGRDDGLKYKKYSPSSPEDDWFGSVKYKNKTIMKFRFSRVLRGYGYRKGDKFRLLRLERDHTISDKG